MKDLLKKVSLVAAIAVASVGSANADPKAEKVLAKARYAATLGHQDLKGFLRKDGKRQSITLYLRKTNIQFLYYEKNAWKKFHMKFKTGGAQLYSIEGKKERYFNKKKLGESILGTDFTFEDLSMNFLYWKKSEVVKEEFIKTQRCQLVRLYNPGGEGKYDIVYAWVNKKYGSLMQVIGCDKNNRVLKKFAVDKLMKVNGEYTLKRMRVDAFNPKTKRVIGTTYLEFQDKKAKRNKDL